MSANLNAALGFLLTWGGFLGVFVGLARAISKKRDGYSWLSVAATSLFVGQKLSGWFGPVAKLPIVWPMMPLSGWLGIIFLFGLLHQGVEAFLCHDRLQRSRHLAWAGGWAVLTSYCIYELSIQKSPPSLLKGSIPMSAGTFFAGVGVMVVAIGAMSYASHWNAGRIVSKKILTHLTLIFGSVLFGLPFAFLVITSFKEDRDMSSENGIIWVPRVQRTVPYLDPEHPRYAATYNGQKVEATIMSESNGKALMDVQRPMSLRGVTFETPKSALTEIPISARLVTTRKEGEPLTGIVAEDLEDGRVKFLAQAPPKHKGEVLILEPSQTEPIRDVGLRWQNYTEALSFLPPETMNGLLYVRNSLILVVMSVVGTLLSSSIVAFAFARMTFPGKNFLFGLMLSTLMLPGAVTLLPQFLIFRQLGWIDTLLPLWVPAFFGSAFNIFMLRQFFLSVPMELEDAAKIDGCSYFASFWKVLLPQVKPALAVIAIWTFMGAWNNFMGPLIYTNSPENMPVSYVIQLFQGDRSSEPGLIMALTTLSICPVLLVFFVAQKYFIEGVQLSGLGGR